MYTSVSEAPLLRFVANLERQCFDRWRNEHQPGYAICDALALGSEGVITTLERKRGGNVLVTVSIHGNPKRTSESYYFHLQRAGKTGYVLAGAS